MSVYIIYIIYTVSVSVLGLPTALLQLSVQICPLNTELYVNESAGPPPALLPRGLKFR